MVIQVDVTQRVLAERRWGASASSLLSRTLLPSLPAVLDYCRVAALQLQQEALLAQILPRQVSHVPVPVACRNPFNT